MLFVGEARSNRAKELGITWETGGLAAKPLFDALLACKIDPSTVEFTNWFEYGGKTKVRNYEGTVIAMGRKVERALIKENIEHTFIIHPAARGNIRKKANYKRHVKKQLATLGA